MLMNRESEEKGQCEEAGKIKRLMKGRRRGKDVTKSRSEQKLTNKKRGLQCVHYQSLL